MIAQIQKNTFSTEKFPKKLAFCLMNSYDQKIPT